MTIIRESQPAARPPSLETALSSGGDEAAHGLGSVFFIGTATTLIRLGGFTLLTDPNFLHAGEQIHLGIGLKSRRLTNPAIEIEELPPLDLCIVSHLHEDHFDRTAAMKLPRDLRLLAPPSAAKALAQQGFERARPLPTWSRAVLRRGDEWVRVSAMPARHGPALVNELLPETMGSMVEYGSAANPELPHFRLYISGDTLLDRKLRDIRRRYPEIDLALVHLGGTRVLGLLVTMNAEQGTRILQALRPRTAIPIHYNDYTVFKSPLSDFKVAVRRAGLEGRVRYLAHGERYHF